VTEVYDQLVAGSAADARFPGVAIGVVTNNDDPLGLGRVKVGLPWLTDLPEGLPAGSGAVPPAVPTEDVPVEDGKGHPIESNWARVAAPMAGPGRGCYFLPEVGDEVLVAFEHGNPDSPYVLGGLWNGKDAPPVPGGAGRADVRAIVSRTGHVIRLVDKADKEQDEKADGEGIEIVDRSGNGIRISTADGRITITAAADIEITSTGGVLRLGGHGVEIDSQAGLTVRASGTLDITGRQVNIN
jgi:uncharacterized protein involved in type VI secretion and phage assembly